MKYIKIIITFLVVLITGFTMLNPMDNYISKLRSDELNRYPEKTYIHTDKPFYTTKDTIWFKSYLVNGISHLQTEKSNVVYVEFISPKDSILYKEKFYVPNEAFGSAGEIPIDPAWESGTYQLRSYTNYMRNISEKYFFRKAISIQKNEKKLEVVTFIDKDKLKVEPVKEVEVEAQKILDDITVKLYPEGGTILANQENKFGIKATDKKGKGVKIIGNIKETNSKTIIKAFRTFDFGLGNVSFILKEGVQYEAEIELNGKTKVFNIEQASSKGVQLSITNSKEKLILKATTNTSNLKNYFIIGHLRGKLFFNKEISTSENSINYSLITSELPSGIVHFTLFDPLGKPKAERLVFIDNPQKTSEAKIILSKTKFKKREKVDYNVEVFGAKKTSKSASLSMSVTQKNLVPLSTKENIKSWMLLNSDLRGEIPNAAFFFDPSKSINERKYLLESLMLTHGWRRFMWEKLAKKKFKDLTFKPEKGISIRGKSLASDPELINKQAETTLLLSAAGNTYVDKQKTKVNNEFIFNVLLFAKNIEGMLQAKALGVKKKKERNLKIVLDEELSSPKIAPLTKIESEKEGLYFEKYKKVNEYIDQVNFTFNGTNLLDEVLLTGKKAVEEEEKIIRQIVDDLAPVPYVPRNRFSGEDIARFEGLTVFEVISGTPGVKTLLQLQAEGGQTPSNIGTRDNLFLLNGNEIGGLDLTSVPVENIAIIDIIKGNDAALYRANVVIAVYLKQGVNPALQDEDTNTSGGLKFTVTPFYRARRFYSKSYLTESEKSNFLPDYRTTLHWNPSLNVSKNKKLKQAFYTGDQTGIFQFELEGVTEEGQLIYTTKEIEVVE